MYYRRPSGGPGDYFFLKGLFGSPEQKAEQQRQHKQFWNGVGSAIKATKKHFDEKGKFVVGAINGLTAATTIVTEAASGILGALFGQKNASEPVQLLKSTSPPSSTQKVASTTAAPEVDHDIEDDLDNDSDRDDDDDDDEDSEPLDSSGVSEQSDSEYFYYDDDSDSYETEEYEESSADYEDS